MKNLRRTSRRHQAANSEIYHEFPPGSRVTTVEGFPGIVIAVEDGPFPGDEQYVVELDGGMGGGEYQAGELTALAGERSVQASKTAAIPMTCDGCGDDYFTDGEPHGCVTGHVASTDYPELVDILVERPPLAHSTTASLRTTAAAIPPLPDYAILQQFSQYPQSGSGITYFRGEISADLWVDCLLSYKDGRLVGVLNHYPQDMGPERKGNVLLMVHPDYRRQGIGKALWEEAKRRYNVTAAGQDQTPDGSAFTSRVGHLAALAAIWDRVLDPVAQRMLDAQEQSGYGTFNADTGAAYSVDWCRFRHNRRCFFPKQLDEKGTQEAGYAVYVPEDRGLCPRDKWADQKACPAPAEPGPKSGERNWNYETYKSWAQGGQGRYGSKSLVEIGMPSMPVAAARTDLSVEDMSKKVPVEDPMKIEYQETLDEVVQERVQQKKNPYAGANPFVTSALVEGEFGFHFTAAWKDVQAKAKKIREGGKVRIISASPEYLVGEVQGDKNIYQATLMREPGTQKVALWECGCAWASYSWGRSGRWKKYEGRLCSHALALNYEGQSRGWGGGNIQEDRKTPSWRADQQVRVPGDYVKPEIGQWRKAGLVTDATLHYARIDGGFATIEEAAIWMNAEAQKYEARVTPILQRAARDSNGEMQGLAHRFKTVESLVRKLKTKGVDPRRITEPFKTIKDALRYTVAFPEPDWGNSVQEALWEIQGAGFRITEEENSWARGDSYSGLHYNLQPNGSDLVFELQFHSTRSYTLKEKVLHRMYEEFRDSSTPLPRRQFLFDEMTKHWDNIPLPANSLDFPGEKHFLRPVASLRSEMGTARIASTDPDLTFAPVHAVVAGLREEGKGFSEIVSVLASLGISQAAMSDWVGPDDLVTVADLKPGDHVWAQRDEIGARHGVAATVVSNGPGGVVIRYDHSGHTSTITDEDLVYNWDLRLMDAVAFRTALQGRRTDQQWWDEQTPEERSRFLGQTRFADWLFDFPWDDLGDLERQQLSQTRAEMLRYSPVERPAYASKEAGRVKPFKGLVRGRVVDVLDVADGTVETTSGPVQASDVMYPTYHPSRGLNFRGSKTADIAEIIGEGYEGEADRFGGGDVERIDIGEGRDTEWGHLPFGGGDFDFLRGGGANDQFAFEGELHDEPEPALPVTTADDEESEPERHQSFAEAFVQSVDLGPTAKVSSEFDWIPDVMMGRTTAATESDDLDSGDEVMLEGVEDFVPGDARLAHLMTGTTARKGSDDMQIADAARAMLLKDPEIQRTALKAFSPAEQKQIIEEGADIGAVAANLASLDITGTHYAPLEAAFKEAEAEDDLGDDESWLS